MRAPVVGHITPRRPGERVLMAVEFLPRDASPVPARLLRRLEPKPRRKLRRLPPTVSRHDRALTEATPEQRAALERARALVAGEYARRGAMVDRHRNAARAYTVALWSHPSMWDAGLVGQHRTFVRFAHQWLDAILAQAHARHDSPRTRSAR